MAAEDYPPGVSFKRIMAVKKISPDIFESITLAWPPGIVPTRTYGGHVFAQSVYAASKTVGKGMVVHNVNGHFLLPGRSDVPFTYRVRRIRDGGVYSLRGVEVFQNVEGQAAKDPWRVERAVDTPCFIATISYKRGENAEKTTSFAHQNAPADHIRRTYASVLGGVAIEDHPRSPSADAQWYIDSLGDRWIKSAETFPGIEIKKVDMKAYNGVAEAGGGGKAGEWRQLCFYRAFIDKDDTQPEGDVAEPDEDTARLNLNACAHIYASDRNSLFLIQRALGFEQRQASAGSLAHNVILHGSPQHCRLTDANGHAKWFVQEAWTSNSGANRGCHESRLWDFEEGRILATTLQDGMMRIPKKDYVQEGKGREGKL